MVMRAHKGVVKGNKVRLEKGAQLPDGTEVVVTPLEMIKGSPPAVLAAVDAPPYLKPEDVEEFRRLIKEGRRPVSYEDPFKKARRKRKQLK